MKTLITILVLFSTSIFANNTKLVCKLNYQEIMNHQAFTDNIDITTLVEIDEDISYVIFNKYKYKIWNVDERELIAFDRFPNDEFPHIFSIPKYDFPFTIGYKDKNTKEDLNIIEHQVHIDRVLGNITFFEITKNKMVYEKKTGTCSKSQNLF